MVALSDCGHMSCLEQPALVAEAMEEWIQQEHEEGEVSGLLSMQAGREKASAEEARLLGELMNAGMAGGSPVSKQRAL